MAIRPLLSIAAAAAFLLLVGCGDSGSESGESGSTKKMALMNCAGEPKVEPKVVVMTCADFGFQVRNLRWTGWGESRAYGHGLALNKVCNPSCAASQTYKHTRIVLVASGDQTCNGRRDAYRGVTYAFIGKSPYPIDAPGTERPWQVFGCEGV